MTELDNLIKAAEYVLLCHNNRLSPNITSHNIEAIQALRQAVVQAKAVSAEPVGMKLTHEQSLRSDGKAGQFLWWKDIPHGALLYTTPPSIDALIAENKERQEDIDMLHADVSRLGNECQRIDELIAEIESIVKCAETVTDGDTGGTVYIGEAYPEDDIKAVLDKYRGVK